MNLSETDSRTMTVREIIDAFRKGEMAEAYVWRDGMDDWKPLLDVAELAGLLQPSKTPAARANHSPTVPRASAAPAKTAEKGAGTVRPESAVAKTLDPKGSVKSDPKTAKKSDPTAAKKSEPAAAKKSDPVPAKKSAGQAADAKAAAKTTAARVASRGVTPDLFGSLDKVGSEEEPNVDIDHDAAQKLTGARNETSVLFSLDALKAGAAPTPAGRNSSRASPKAPPRGMLSGAPKAQSLEDVLNMGGGDGVFSLGANQALVTAPPPPDPPKPKPAPVVAPKPLTSASPAVAANPTHSPLPPPAKSKKLLLAAIGAGLLLVGGGVAVALVVGGKASEANGAQSAVALPATAPKELPAAKAPTTAEPEKTPAAGADSSAAPDSGADAGSPSAASSNAAAESAAPDAGSGKVALVAAPTSDEEKKRFKEAQDNAKKRDAEKKDAKKEPAGGGSAAAGAFNRDAAVASLTSAASAASSCKRPGGPTGPGRVTVTFAPSGRATTANVSGGAYGGTPVGGCVASVFRRARVPAFSGDAVTVAKSFNISP